MSSSQHFCIKTNWFFHKLFLSTFTNDVSFKIMRSIKILLLISFSMICNNACTTGAKEIAEPEPQNDALVARISSVYPEQNYMLVQKYRSINTEIDAIFYSRGTDGTVNSLKMTGQKLGQFYVADIGEGSFTVNDPVFMRDLRSKEEADADESLQKSGQILKTSP